MRWYAPFARHSILMLFQKLDQDRSHVLLAVLAYAARVELFLQQLRRVQDVVGSNRVGMPGDLFQSSVAELYNVRRHMVLGKLNVTCWRAPV